MYLLLESSPHSPSIIDAIAYRVIQKRRKEKMAAIFFELIPQFNFRFWFWSSGAESITKVPIIKESE